MLIAAIALVAVTLGPQSSEPSKPEVTLLEAGLGKCSADFAVTDAGGKPVYGAKIHVEVRYGFRGLKRADLEVGANPDGLARIEGLPEKTRKPLAYDIQKDDRKAAVEQDVSKTCEAKFAVSLK